MFDFLYCSHRDCDVLECYYRVQTELSCGWFWKFTCDFSFLMYSRFIATKHRLHRFPGTRISLLPQIQLMLPPDLGVAPCSPQPVSWLFLSLSYISTVRDSGQETSLLPHLDPPRMATTSPMWPGRDRSTSNRLLPLPQQKTLRIRNSTVLAYSWGFEWRAFGLQDPRNEI